MKLSKFKLQLCQFIKDQIRFGLQTVKMIYDQESDLHLIKTPTWLNQPERQKDHPQLFNNLTTEAIFSQFITLVDPSQVIKIP